MKDKHLRVLNSKYFVAVVLTVAAFFSILQDVCSPISKNINFSDGAIYQYIGKLIVDGKMPYRNAFDHKGPVLYFINAIGVLINCKYGIWIVDAAFMLIMYIFAYKICNKVMGENRLQALFVTVVVMSGITTVYWIGNTPDFFAGSLSVVAAYIIFDCFTKQNVCYRDAFLIGFLVALCFWMKFTTIGLVGVLCVGLLIYLLKIRDVRSVGMSVVGFLSAFMIIAAILLLWIYKNGAWTDFVNDYIRFNLFYGNMDEVGTSRVSAFSYFVCDTTYLLTMCATIIYVFIRYEKGKLFKDDKNNSDWLVLNSAIALLIQTLICTMPGRSYQQYMAAYYPAFIIIVAHAAKEVIGYNNQKAMQYAALGMAAVVLIPNIVKTVGYQLETQADQESVHLLSYLEPYRGEKIAVATPGECGLYIWNDSESATKYPYVQADLGRDMEFWADYESELESSMPVAIVWTKQFDMSACLPDLYDKYECIGTVEWCSVYVLKQ